MTPDWIVYVALLLAIIVANVIGFAQGYRHGLRQIRAATHARLSKRAVENALLAVTMHRSIDSSLVHWHELPKFLRKDALEQQWRRKQ